jgi:hypothetical protein
MISWHEFLGERIDPRGIGEVRLNTFHETRKKPVWLVLIKLLGAAAMLAAGYALLLPLSPWPLGRSILVVSGILMIYLGLAFFVHPQPDGDNMGWLGGFFNDPTHYSDNINRLLWKLHCLLGPGRFLSETLLDCCTLVGITAEMTAEEANAEADERQQAVEQRQVERWREDALDRVRERMSEKPAGQVELSSARFLSPDRFDSPGQG